MNSENVVMEHYNKLKEILNQVTLQYEAYNNINTVQTLISIDREMGCLIEQADKEIKLLKFEVDMVPRSSE